MSATGEPPMLMIRLNIVVYTSNANSLISMKKCNYLRNGLRLFILLRELCHRDAYTQTTQQRRVITSSRNADVRRLYATNPAAFLADL